MDLYEQAPDSKLFLSDDFNRIQPILQRHEITTRDILTKDAEQLARLTAVDGAKKGASTELKPKEFLYLKGVLSREFETCFAVENAYETLQQARQKEDSNGRKACNKYSTTTPADKFSTGSRHLDDALGGGIPTGYVIELSGESSAGKSQLLMQMSLFCQLPKLYGGLNNINKSSEIKAVFISTEAPVPVSRLLELQSVNFLENPNLTNLPEDQLPTLDNIFTFFLHSWDNQSETLLFHQLPQLIAQHNVRLVIIDSLSHHLRSNLARDEKSETNHWDYRIRTNLYLNRLLDHFKTLAEKFGIAVVVSNQVTSRPLLLKAEGPQPHNILNYENQIGWFSGWDQANIHYNQIVNKYREDVTLLKRKQEEKQDTGTMRYIVAEVSVTGEDIYNEEVAVLKKRKVVGSSASNKMNDETLDLSDQKSDFLSTNNNNEHGDDEISATRHNNKVWDQSRDERKPLFGFNRIVPCLNANWARRVPIRLYLAKTRNPFEVNAKRTEINSRKRLDNVLSLQVGSERKASALQPPKSNETNKSGITNVTNGDLVSQNFDKHSKIAYDSKSIQVDQIPLINLEDVVDNNDLYDRKHYFIRITNSVFGNNGKMMEATVVKQGYRCVHS